MPRPVPLDVAAHDAALSAALVRLPLTHPDAQQADDGFDTYLLGAPTGTALTLTAQCATPTADRSVQVRPAPGDSTGETTASVSFVGSAGPGPTGSRRRPGEAGCEEGPVTAPLPPALRFTPTAGPSRGKELDVFALTVASLATQGTTSSPQPSRDRVRATAAG